METTIYKFGGATVTICDKSSDVERQNRLRKPLEAFFQNILKEEKKNYEEDNKEKIKTVGQSNN